MCFFLHDDSISHFSPATVAASVSCFHLLIYLNHISTSTWTWQHGDKISKFDIFHGDTVSSPTMLCSHVPLWDFENSKNFFEILQSNFMTLRLAAERHFDVMIKLKITVSNYSVNGELIDDFDAWKCLDNQQIQVKTLSGNMCEFRWKVN